MNSPTYPQGHALLIGVANYQRVSSLPASILHDAQDVAATLTSPAYCGYDPGNVVTLLDGQATRVAIMAGLAELAIRACVDDTVCVFFSGHGAVIGSPGDEDSVLVTVDTDLSDIEGTSISSEEFGKALSRIEAKRVLVFIDACHAGGAAVSKSLSDGKGHTFKSGYSQNTFVKLAAGSGRALMASCRVDEVSTVFHGARNSVFTSALLAGLRGAADKAGSGFIRLFDLFNYVAEEVPKQIPDNQHPIFKADNLEVNFAIALSLGGKKGAVLGDLAEVGGLVPTQDLWAALESTLSDLYPFGPRDQEIWSRAGGDLSRLEFQSTGQAAWHSALRKLRQGGGGRSITFATLISTALEDFATHPTLMALRAC